MNATGFVIANKLEFLKFLHSRFVMIHQSNFFFRDMYYGLLQYLTSTGKKISLKDAETVTREVGAELERLGIFKRIDERSWLVNYPDFALPRVEKKAS